MRKRNCLILLSLLSLGACLLVFALYLFQYTFKPQPTPYLAHLSPCPECDQTMGGITIWANPQRQGIVGKVLSGSEVLVYGTQEYNGVLHYHIRYGDIDGWVSYLMIQK